MKLPIILAATALLAWWLSGYDSQATGQNRAADLTRRSIRCGITLVLVALGVAGMSFLFIPVAVVLAILWAGCLSELFARGFHGLVDSADPRSIDTKALSRELDRLAALVQQGRNEEAIQLCVKLRSSAEGSALAIETMLFRVYDQMFAEERLRGSPELAEICQSVEQNRYADAEIRLSQLLVHEPRNAPAYFLLIRLYARELRNASKAHALIDRLGKYTWLPPVFTEYARHCLLQWMKPPSADRTGAEGIESLLVDRKPGEATEGSADDSGTSATDLLASGRLGTAIEILERRLKQRPDEFDTWLMLAEAHGRYCCNMERAREIVHKIETNAAFNAEQVREAKSKLHDWQARLTNRALAVK